MMNEKDKWLERARKLYAMSEGARAVAGDAQNLFAQTMAAVGDPDTATAMVTHEIVGVRVDETLRVERHILLPNL